MFFIRSIQGIYEDIYKVYIRYIRYISTIISTILSTIFILLSIIVYKFAVTKMSGRRHIVVERMFLKYGVSRRRYNSQRVNLLSDFTVEHVHFGSRGGCGEKSEAAHGHAGTDGESTK